MSVIESMGSPSPDDTHRENARINQLNEERRCKGFAALSSSECEDVRRTVRAERAEERRREAIARLAQQVGREHEQAQATPQNGEPMPAPVDPYLQQRDTARQLVEEFAALVHREEDLEGKYHAAQSRRESWSPGLIGSDEDLSQAIITRDTLGQVSRGNFNRSSRDVLDARQKSITTAIEDAKAKGFFSLLEASFLNEKIAAKAERYGRPFWNHPSRTVYIEVLASELEQIGTVGQRLVAFVNSRVGERPRTFGHAGHLLLPGVQIQHQNPPYAVFDAAYADRDLPVIDGLNIVRVMESIADWCRAEEALAERERQEQERIEREKLERERAELAQKFRDLYLNDREWRSEFRAMLNTVEEPVEPSAELAAVAQEGLSDDHM